MDELNGFISKLNLINEDYNGELTVEKSRKIINEINNFLFTTNTELGTVEALGREFLYFSEFHKYWEKHHNDILGLTIDDEACKKVASVLHDVFLKTGGKAFHIVYDTNHLSKEDICRVRLLTANQDFRGSRNFTELSNIFLNDSSLFDEKFIFDYPEDFIKSLKISDLSQNDKRIQFAKGICLFLLQRKCAPYDLIAFYNGDVGDLRSDLIESTGAGYGNKKTDMFIRDMVVLGVWENVKGFDKIDVASDVNTMKVALRTGILKTEIPLISSFLDIFCYQYGYMDKMNAAAWRRVWEYWNKQYPDETIESPCLMDYFIYQVVGKQFCQPLLYTYECENGHIFKWHSSSKHYCPLCAESGDKRINSKIVSRKLPCEDIEGNIAIHNTLFYRSAMANPNYEECPFKNICDDYSHKYLQTPKSISILGKTGWETAYSKTGEGGGGLMA